jgi:DNA-directed RNA polymerase specialized sigma54-like protein
LFDLKYFFSASLGSNWGDDGSATVVKPKIKALVQADATE